MDYISGFGIKFAAPILALAALGTSALIAAEPAGVDVTINVDGLRNAKGQVMLCLSSNPKAFPDCRKDPTALKRRVPAAQAGRIVFPNVAPGTYAAALVHDENQNNKMDLLVMIPKEGFAFTRNPSISFGPPKFSSASFQVGSSNISQRVKMKYM